MLLPHGYEGQGPEHSSARMERFLTLCAESNMQVCDVTTASQLFHLLRRQVVRDMPKPLVLFTPKAFLRAPEAYSPVEEFTTGVFNEVIDDVAVVDRDAVKRVTLATGKVSLEAAKTKAAEGVSDVAVVRVEQLYPYPEAQILDILASYPNVTEVCWLQEEPENMGAWGFMHARLLTTLAGSLKLVHSSRHESGSPAAGSKELSELEKADVLHRALHLS